jgi:hypothetical protein
VEVLIRYYCDPQDDLGFTYFEALKALGHRIRVLPIGLVDVRDPRWGVYLDNLVMPIDGPYINMVCSPNDDSQFNKLYTVGVNNVALVDRVPSEKAIAALRRYVVVFGSTIEVCDLWEHQVPILYMPPDILRSLSRRDVTRLIEMIA